MAPDAYNLTAAHLRANDGWLLSACGSCSSTLDCMVTMRSFSSNGLGDGAKGEYAHHGALASGMPSGAAQSGSSGLAENEIVCQAAVFFANSTSAVAALGCPCKSCVRSVELPPADGQQLQFWRYHRTDQASHIFNECFQTDFEGRRRDPCGQPWNSSPGSPGSTVSPSEQTLRMLLDRARLGVDVTARSTAGVALGGRVFAPAAATTAPVPLTALRRTAPGGIVRPVYQHFQASPLYRRPMEARSTSPIPVPPPPPPSRSSSGVQHDPHRRRIATEAAAVARRSFGDALYCKWVRAPYGSNDGDAAECVDDLQHDKMVDTVKRFYDARRRERAKRPPGRPSEPQCVVIGFET